MNRKVYIAVTSRHLVDVILLELWRKLITKQLKENVTQNVTEAQTEEKIENAID